MRTKTFIFPILHGKHLFENETAKIDKTIDNWIAHMRNNTENFIVHNIEIRTVSDSLKENAFYHLIYIFLYTANLPEGAD